MDLCQIYAFHIWVLQEKHSNKTVWLNWPWKWRDFIHGAAFPTARAHTSACPPPEFVALPHAQDRSQLRLQRNGVMARFWIQDRAEDAVSSSHKDWPPRERTHPRRSELCQTQPYAWKGGNRRIFKLDFRRSRQFNRKVPWTSLNSITLIAKTNLKSSRLNMRSSTDF